MDTTALEKTEKGGKGDGFESACDLYLLRKQCISPRNKANGALGFLNRRVTRRSAKVIRNC